MLLSSRPRRHSAPLLSSSRRCFSRSGGSSGMAAAQLPPAPCGPATLLLLGALMALVFMSVWQAAMVSACTTIVLGAKATDDGSVIVTHNNDCEDCDVRIGVVPAMDHPKGSQCAIYPCGFDFPRYVGSARGPLYTRSHLAQERLSEQTGWALPNDTAPLGFIPEVEHTYAYFDGSYGMMNEHQLAIGESTCGARIAAYSPARGGEALMEASTLTRLAMQRCKTARCAVDLIGYLSETYGFAGSEDPEEEGEALFDVAGEALTIVDPSEAWVLHVLADSTGRSAIWAAARLPDGHVAVVPNQFVIDRINVSDTDNVRTSSDIVGAAVAAGLITAEEAEADGGAEHFHFSRAFSLEYPDLASGANGGEGERRRWRIFSLLAPSLQLDPAARMRLPFSVAVEHPVSLAEVQSLMRDHYEGTRFDATRGLAAGPFGNPERFDRDTQRQPESAQGFFERSVSIHRTSYSFVAQAKSPEAVARAQGDKDGKSMSVRDDGHDDASASNGSVEGVLWFAHHSPATSLYLPLFCRSLSLPASFARGSLFRLSRDAAWWAFAAVANSAQRMYQPIHAYIAARQNKLEEQSRQQVADMQQQAAELVQKGKHDEARKQLTNFTVAHNEALVSQWWQLLDELTYTFRDGVVVQSPHPPLVQDHLFYPSWWLEKVGFFAQGPLVKPSYPAVPRPLHALPAAAAQQASEPAAQKKGLSKHHSASAAPSRTAESREDDGDSIEEDEQVPARTRDQSSVLVQRRDRHASRHEGRAAAKSSRSRGRSHRTQVLAQMQEVEEQEEQHPQVLAAAEEGAREKPDAADEHEQGDAGAGADEDSDSADTASTQPRNRSRSGEDESQSAADEPARAIHHPNHSMWHFFHSRRWRWPVAAGLFTLCLLLVGCACFQLGRLCYGRGGRVDRAQYQPISESIAQGLEAGQHGSREGFSRTGPHAVLSTR